MDSRRPEEAIQPLHHGLHALFRQRLHHTGERGKRLRSSLVFRALRHLASDHRWTQDAFGTIVGRLDPWVLQEAQQVATIMVPADLIEQPLIVGLYLALYGHEVYAWENG